METKLFCMHIILVQTDAFKLGDLKIIEMHWNLISAPSKKTQPKPGHVTKRNKNSTLFLSSFASQIQETI